MVSKSPASMGAPIIRQVAGVIFEKERNERSINMLEKKVNPYKSPDLTKMQEIIIDYRTRIYIEPGASAKDAKESYLSKLGIRNRSYLVSRNPAAPK